MIKSFTNKIKTFVFNDSSRDNHVTQSRKRKRDQSEGDEHLDDDVVVTSVKKARKLEPQTATLNYFNTLIVNPYQKMAEWFQKKRAWSDHYFFKKAPNGDSRVEESSGGSTRVDQSQPTVTTQGHTSVDNRTTMGSHAPNGNGRHGYHTGGSLGTNDGMVQARNISTSISSSNPAQSHPPNQTESAGKSSTSQTSRTTTSVQTENSDIGYRMNEYETVQLNRHDNRSLFSRPPRQKFTALECVRLDEMKKYKQLLQHYTRYSLEKSSHSPERLGASQLLHYGSRTEGSISGSNSSLELYSVSRQPDVRRQKVVPTQKTCVISPPRHKENKLSISPRQHLVMSPRRLTETDQQGASKSESQEEVICLDDEDSDVICIPDDHEKAYSPTVNGFPSPGSRLAPTRSPEVIPDHPHVTQRWDPAFQSSKYLSEDWIVDLERQFSRANREAQRKIKEAEIKKKFHEEKHLRKDQSLESQVRQRLRLYEAEPPVLEDQQVEEDKFPELTDKMLAVVNDALRPQPSEEVLVEGYKLQIRRRDMESLAGLNWLNDEIINFYMNQLVERGEQEGKPKVYAFNTFFYPKVMGQGHESVRRWTRRVDIFSKDYILIPVHLGMHWCLAVIDFKKKMIRYFDSMGGNNVGCLNALKDYLCAESLDKKKQKFDLSEWKTEIAKDIPQQMNGSDCGMFACKFAEYITREADINFSQEHMPYFRKRMVYEIVTKQLLQ